MSGNPFAPFPSAHTFESLKNGLGKTVEELAEPKTHLELRLIRTRLVDQCTAANHLVPHHPRLEQAFKAMIKSVDKSLKQGMH